MALEVLHKMFVQPTLLRWLCENYDNQPNATPLVRMMLQKLVAFTKGFHPTARKLVVKRWILLDWLEKHEAGPVPEGYCLSIAYACLVDSTHSIFAAIDQKSPVEGSGMETNLSRQLFYSTYSHLLDGLAILLDCSIDDTISDAILNCLSTIVILACRFGATPHTTNSPTTNHPENPKEQALKTICQAALPQNYFHKFIETLSPTTLNQHHATGGLPGVPSQVVAMGTICPIPCLPPSMFNFTVMLTAKNMQVSRVLIACAQSNGLKLTDCWDMVLAVLQHLVWILGMKPTSAGSFRTGGDTTGTSLVALDNSNSTTSGTSSAASSTVLTTAVSSELPDLNLALNRLFESTSTFDDVSLHHVIAALSKLLQTAVANLPRLEVFWKPVTAHLLEVCAHTNTCLREWGAVALTVLVKNAMKQLSGTTSAKTVDLTKKESLILTPLAAMSEVEFVDVRTKQLDCLMHVLLESDSQQLMPQIWPLIVGIVTSIVDTCSNAQLIEQGYAAVSLMVKEFLGVLPFDCVQMLVETDAKYGQQQLDLNVSLAAVGQLWDISDYVRRESVNQPKESQVEHVWLVIYKCLSELCVDQRPPVRKSACDTLLQTVAAHGHALKPSTWSEMLWKTLFPMLDKVRVMTTGAKTERTNTTALGATNIMIHHSRDTESKQWAETTVKTLSGVVKIFNSQRSILLSLDTFSELWPRLLEYIEMTASMDNSEMSLAALKNLQELLFGRQQGDNKDKQSSIIEDTSLAQLPEKLWLVSWATWIRIAWLIVQPTVKGRTANKKATFQAHST
uniref:Mon2 C-terminal domain-containing protein n=1 Tax=Ditylenchus dipsaci TaxID=166011 RepID=A0A915D9Y5_9BILA